MLHHWRQLVVVADQHDSLETTAINGICVLEQHGDERFYFKHLSRLLHHHAVNK
jgi:hypothetical protein